jgi:hypothetical protein
MRGPGLIAIPGLVCRRRFPESRPVALPRLDRLRQTHMATAAAAVDLGLEKRFPLPAIRIPRAQPQALRWASAKLTCRVTGRP